jgi:hypothetical protein
MKISLVIVVITLSLRVSLCYSQENVLLPEPITSGRQITVVGSVVTGKIQFFDSENSAFTIQPFFQSVPFNASGPIAAVRVYLADDTKIYGIGGEEVPFNILLPSYTVKAEYLANEVGLNMAQNIWVLPDEIPE